MPNFVFNFFIIECYDFLIPTKIPVTTSDLSTTNNPVTTTSMFTSTTKPSSASIFDSLNVILTASLLISIGGNLLQVICFARLLVKEAFSSSQDQITTKFSSIILIFSNYLVMITPYSLLLLKNSSRFMKKNETKRARINHASTKVVESVQQMRVMMRARLMV